MEKYITLYQKNKLYVLFSYAFSFFLVCSYVFGHDGGFQTGIRVLLIALVALLLTPFFCILFIRLSSIEIRPSRFNSKLNLLYDNKLFYIIALFIMQLPVFLAFYPGMCYYDLPLQIEQYDIPYFVQNHPLLHTLFMGFFKNLFSIPNTGYAIATIIQMLIVDLAIAYALLYVYRKKRNLLLCTLALLFYGLLPVNSVLIISTTKDILFAAFLLVFFIDMLRLYQHEFTNSFSFIRCILNTVLMLLFRNNAIYAFIPSFALILLISLWKKDSIKKLFIYIVISLGLYTCLNQALIKSLNAVPGSIKEMMSIPCQQMACIYHITDDEDIKETIRSYIPEPENYCYYLSDRIKQQLDFDTFDSACKHFLLYTAIYDLKYPIAAFDAAFYNTQGYWDLFHSPYQSDHFFLAASAYRGDAVLDSKFPWLTDLYLKFFHVTEEYQHNPLAVLFLNSGIYIWIFLFALVNAMHKKNRPLIFSCLFFLFYLGTLILGPGAIIRYAFPFILLAPVFQIGSDNI